MPTRASVPDREEGRVGPGPAVPLVPPRNRSIDGLGWARRITRPPHTGLDRSNAKRFVIEWDSS